MTDSKTNVQRKYGTLYRLGQVISVLGWLLVGLGAVAVLAGLASLGSDSVLRALSGGFVWIGLASAFGGVLTVAQGQLITCFVSIEENTRRTAHIVDGQWAGRPEAGRTPEEAVQTRTDEGSSARAGKESNREERRTIQTEIGEMRVENDGEHCVVCGAVTETNHGSSRIRVCGECLGKPGVREAINEDGAWARSQGLL